MLIKVSITLSFALLSLPLSRRKTVTKVRAAMAI